MKVLYVVGTNLSMNTSANISHNAYVEGLLENGCEVDILMSSSSWGEKDDSLPVFEEATYHIYKSTSIIDRLKKSFKNIFDGQVSEQNRLKTEKQFTPDKGSSNHNLKKVMREVLKKSYQLIFNTSHIYNLDRTWLRKALQFKENSPYDVIISNSSPASSHKMVLDLLSKKHVTETRWIQIWEDPWFFDIYADHRDELKLEEHRLLKAAKEIFYVSILTMEYQKDHFPDCAHKMKHIPLPYLKLNENNPPKHTDEVKFGYFGDYYSKTRNLQHFYDALVKSGAFAYINGDTDLSLESTKLISVNGRVTLDQLNKLQDQTDVLVHLCNLKGGQIPGKIYHYSATTKPILFILDGTTDEKIMIKEYFSKFNRYHFCENAKEDILTAINHFLDVAEDFKKQPVEDFAPKQVIAELLKSQLQNITDLNS